MIFWGGVSQCALIAMVTLTTTSCAILHPGVAVLFPLDNASISRDTIGSTIASYGVALSALPEMLEKPAPATFSCGFAILTPGPTQREPWRVEHIVGLVDSQSSRLPILPQQFNAPPKHVPVSACYRPLDQKVVLQVTSGEPDSSVRNLLGTHACRELAIKVSINENQEAFFDSLFALTDSALLGPPCIPR